MVACGDFSFSAQNINKASGFTGKAGCRDQMTEGYLMKLVDHKEPVVKTNATGRSLSFPTDKSPIYMAICQACAAPVKGNYYQYTHDAQMSEESFSGLRSFK